SDVIILSDVLFLANEQHSPWKLAIFKEKLLDKILKKQIQVLLNNVPSNTPNFDNDDLIKMVNVVTDLDYQNTTPKVVKLSLLVFAAGLGPYKAKVAEDVADIYNQKSGITLVKQRRIAPSFPFRQLTVKLFFMRITTGAAKVRLRAQHGGGMLGSLWHAAPVV
ncbi:hypothetical protein INT45_010849, partial [Circinella minor]